ncbi:MAG: CBS domain-containing protein [Proteobacteria bacterium]|nr:CBS domain-containing protein [Pseudomonadota bacterium]
MKTAEDIVKTKGRKLISVSPETTILEVLTIMSEHRTGSIMIKGDDDKIIGIWTERNLLRNSVLDEFNVKTARIGDYMSTDIIAAPHDVSIYNLMDIYLKEYIRRILIEKDGEFIGMVYVFDVLEEILDEKNRQLKELNSLVNFEYYKRDWRKPR